MEKTLADMAKKTTDQASHLARGIARKWRQVRDVRRHTRRHSDTLGESSERAIRRLLCIRNPHAMFRTAGFVADETDADTG